MDRALNPYDEGVILTGALRVAAGEVPHRDFYANYGPAQFYLLAFLFDLIGPYAWIERGLDVFVRAGIVTFCYALAARCVRTFVAIATAALCALVLLVTRFHGYPIFPVVLLALAGTFVIAPALDSRNSPKRLFGAGAITGLAALFRYDAGFLVFAALASAIALSAYLTPQRYSRKIRLVASMLLCYGLGTSAVFIPAALLYLANAPLSAFVHDIILYPLQYYARMRALPLPDIFESDAAVYFPPLVWFAAVYVFRGELAHLRTPSDNPRDCRHWTLVVLGLVAAALYAKGWVRVSFVHMLGSIIPSLVILAALTASALQGSVYMRMLGTVSSILVLGAGLSAATDVVGSRDTLGWSILSWLQQNAGQTRNARPALCATAEELHSITCFTLSLDRAAAARYLARHTEPGERVFIGLARHDKIFINDTLTYFAANRLPATHWHHFDPGLQTRADVQADIVRELEAQTVRYALITAEWDHVNEPNESSRSSGVHLLDTYLREHFVVEQKYGAISVLARRSR